MTKPTEAMIEVANRIMLAHSPCEGGSPRVDWYALRNDIAAALTAESNAVHNAEHARCNDIIRAAWGKNISIEGMEAALSIPDSKDLQHTEEVEATLQERVHPWMMACFGPEISSDRLERNDRFIEEALELVQASDYPKERALALVDYVYGRDQGEINQEVGGVMITLAAHCLAHGVDMHQAGETELARVWTKVEKIRAKQAAKPTGSALPIALSPLKVEGPSVKVKPLEWRHDGNSYFSYCGVTDVRWTARNPAERAYAEAERETRIRSALESSAPVKGETEGWRPIETAPKDGTEIIGVFSDDYGYQEKPTVYGPYTIRWLNGEWVSSWDGCRVICSQTDFGTTYQEVDLPPTHWMPLPASPERGETE